MELSLFFIVFIFTLYHIQLKYFQEAMLLWSMLFGPQRHLSTSIKLMHQATKSILVGTRDSARASLTSGPVSQMCHRRPHIRFVLCCCYLESLKNFLTRGHHFYFALALAHYVASPANIYRKSTTFIESLWLVNFSKGHLKDVSASRSVLIFIFPLRLPSFQTYLSLSFRLEHKKENLFYLSL